MTIDVFVAIINKNGKKLKLKDFFEKFEKIYEIALKNHREEVVNSYLNPYSDRDYGSYPPYPDDDDDSFLDMKKPDLDDFGTIETIKRIREGFFEDDEPQSLEIRIFYIEDINKDYKDSSLNNNYENLDLEEEFCNYAKEFNYGAFYKKKAYN